jgi:hypothetical protein
MGSDEEYQAFLDKANSDVSGANTSTSKPKSTANTSSVPAALQNIDAFYSTDSDEPFEPIALEYDGKKVPSAKELGELIGKEVEKISRKEFEAGGDYEQVIQSVEGTVDGSVGFFRVELGGTRSEVWVVGVGKGGLVGVKALAVMS